MDCFLLPSFYEGLPVVGIEAQFSGLKTYLSDSIDKTVDFSNQVYFLPINNGTKIWIKSISRSYDRMRINNYKYDINYAWYGLKKLYVESIKKFEGS